MIDLMARLCGRFIWLPAVAVLLSVGIAEASEEPRRVRLHSPCEEDEYLKLVHMRRYRKDVYECTHVEVRP